MSKRLGFTDAEVARFWRYVDSSTGPEACWPWTRGRDAKVDGYGIFWAAGKSWRAHRVAFALTHELDDVPPPDMPVMHEQCDNPPCCNPAHLVLGTHEENMVTRGMRRRAARGERNGASKLTEEQAIEIRERARSGESASQILGPEFGVSSTTVRQIRDGKIWAHAGDDTVPEFETAAAVDFPPKEPA